LVEHNIKQALKIADAGYILEIGEIVAMDATEKLLAWRNGPKISFKWLKTLVPVEKSGHAKLEKKGSVVAEEVRNCCSIVPENEKPIEREEILMKKGLSKILALVLTVFMLLTFVACGSSDNGKTDATKADANKAEKTTSDTSGGTTSGSSDNVIRFAVVGPMTGDNAAQGKQQEFGVRLAVDEINAAGGINGAKLEYDVYDDQGKTDQAVLCAEKIIANDYRFVLSPIASGCTIAAYPTWATKNLPVISGTNTADHITEQGFKNYLRVCYKDGALLEQLAKIAVEDYGAKRPAIFYASSETHTVGSKQLTEILKNDYGVEVVASAQFEPDTEKDYNAHITNFMGANADIVFILSEYTPAGLFLKQKYAVGWDVPCLSLAGCSNPQIVEIAGKEAAEGFISLSGFDASNPDERVQKFVKDYVDISGGVEPGEWAAGYYDAVYVFANALKDPEGGKLYNSDLVEWVRANTNYDGIMGHVRFDEKGDNPDAAAVILVIKDGKFVVRQ